jgi:putative oxidoreductase
MDWLFSTTDSRTRAFQRIVLALVIFPHGAQKLFGWFGGYGFDGTMKYLTEGAGLPSVVALLVILAESFGSILLAFGFLSRIAAAGIAAVMFGAIAIVHAKVGFFMNWSGQQQGEGFEFHLLALALALPVALLGGGAASVDQAIWRRLRERRRPTLPHGEPVRA